nr:DUF1294 domain-containing protein [Paenibacillus turpanensis]
MSVLLIYFIAINAVSFVQMGYDKSLAVEGKRRVPEKRLFWFAAAGGAAGTWAGMQFWRHKTKHASFVYGIPALFILNVLGYGWIFTLL